MTGKMRGDWLAFVALFAMPLFVASCESEKVDIPGPTIHFASEGSFEIEPDDTLTIEPKITYDNDKSRKYTWYIDGVPVSDKLNYEFIPAGMKDYKLTFMIENGLGSDTSEVVVSVRKNIDFSTFVNYTFPKKATIAYQVDTLEELGGFVQKDILFKSTPVWGDSSVVSCRGFAACSKVSTSTSLTKSTWGTAYVSSASANGYMSVDCTYEPAIVKFDREYKVKSLKLTNDNAIYLMSKYGAQMVVDSTTTEVFNYAQQDDYYRVKIYGLDKNGNETGTVYAEDLVNCEYDNPAKFYRCTDWKAVDLESLGQIYGLKMEVETSSSLANYPLMFCIDELKVQD